MKLPSASFVRSYNFKRWVRRCARGFLYALFAFLAFSCLGIGRAHALEIGNTNTANSRALAQGFRGILIPMPEDGQVVAIRSFAQHASGGQFNGAIYALDGSLVASCTPAAMPVVAGWVEFTGCTEAALVSGVTYRVGVVAAGSDATRQLGHGGAAQTFDGVQCAATMGSINPPPTCPLSWTSDSTRDFAIVLIYSTEPAPPPPNQMVEVWLWSLFCYGAMCGAMFTEGWGGEA